MRSNDAREALERLLAARGLDAATLAVRDGIDTMLDFYRTVRADDCVIADDGDMLLFEWGRFDVGDLHELHLALIRQLIPDEIWQLSLTFVYPPAAVASGQHWCTSPAELDAFAAVVEPAIAALPLGTPLRVELKYEPAG